MKRGTPPEQNQKHSKTAAMSIVQPDDLDTIPEDGLSQVGSLVASEDLESTLASQGHKDPDTQGQVSDGTIAVNQTPGLEGSAASMAENPEPTAAIDVEIAMRNANAMADTGGVKVALSGEVRSGSDAAGWWGAEYGRTNTPASFWADGDEAGRSRYGRWDISADSKHWPSVGVTLGQRLPRCPNVSPTLDRYFVSQQTRMFSQCLINDDPAL